jgi:uncharacterized protein YdhG (YjbR/CyaY superfamily)
VIQERPTITKPLVTGQGVFAMETSRKKYRTIEEYIALLPKEVRESMEKLRLVIKESAPEAEQKISYGLPTFDLKGKHLVFFGAFKKHISLYPVSSGMINAFKSELPQFQTSTGTLQFPLDKPIPYDLVKRIVELRVKEILTERNDLNNSETR